MFLETRAVGDKKKYYLIHTYRIGGSVRRVSHFLGTDLGPDQLISARKAGEITLLKQIRGTSVFTLRDSEIEAYKSYDKRLEIHHLQKHFDWGKFTEEFTYNTNAIEGSRVVLKEVKSLLGKHSTATSSDEIETLNVAKAVEHIRNSSEKMSMELILRLHKMCFTGTKDYAGSFRDVEVVIKDRAGNIMHMGAPFKQINSLLKELVDWYNMHEKKHSPLLLAAVVHDQFEHIHPFQDGNGRVGRLLLNYVLLHHGYPPVNIRFKDRTWYYKTLRIFDRTGDVRPTLRFLISQFRK
ncbi:MAG: Fic family protein [Candidatus Woesearchaeota archaeon]